MPNSTDNAWVFWSNYPVLTVRDTVQLAKQLNTFFTLSVNLGCCFLLLDFNYIAHIQPSVIEGCSCKSGFVLSGNECVAEEECGCKIDNKYYKVDIMCNCKDCS